MVTIQVTLEEKLLSRLDKALKGRRRQRSAFIRQSIGAQLDRERIRRLEAQHREGYLRTPVREGEFPDLSVQAWPEDWQDDAKWKKWSKR